MMNSGNPILDKNLECIASYNPELSEKILNLPHLNNQIELIETDLKEPNLLYNGIPLHDQSGAEAEAKKGFDEVKNTPTSRHIVFGLGIGYLFKEFCERSKGIIFLYEPNLEILRVTLELVDFSKELSQENVFVANDIKFLKLGLKAAYMYRCNPSFLALPSYRNILYENDIESVMEELRTVFVSCMESFKLSKISEENSINMVLHNIPRLMEATPLNELRDIYKGKTALIIGAGPTLDLNIETIKKNRDKVVIFSVGTAYKALLKNGIMPDFVNVIEINDSSGQFIGLDMSEVNLITETYTHNLVLNLDVKRRFLYPSSLSYANNFWAQIADFDVSHYHVKGTVTYAALASAKMLGCSKLILVGQDLAYVNNQCYSSGAVYSDMVYEVDPETKQLKFKVKDEKSFSEAHKSINQNIPDNSGSECAKYRMNLYNTTLCQARGVTGEMVNTLLSYILFGQDFEEFAYINPDLELINSSMLGLQINGFENIPLEKAIEDSPAVQPVTLKSLKPSSKVVIENLENLDKQLGEFLEIFSVAKEYLRKYEREIDRYKQITSASVKYVQAALSLYEKLAMATEVNGENFMYMSLAYVENASMKFILKEYEKFTNKEIEDTYNCLKEYFTNVEVRVIDKKSLMQKQIDLLKEQYIESNN